MKKLKLLAFLILIFSVMPITTYSASIKEKIEVQKDYAAIEVDGKRLKSKTYLYEDTQYAPIDEVAHALGGKVVWEENSKVLKITSSQSNNIELSYKTAVDYYEPVISGEDYNFDPDTIEAYTLMKKNEKIDAVVSFEKNRINITPHTWMDLNTNYTLKLFINNGNRVSINFKTSGLPKLVSEMGQKIIFVPPQPDKGFNYPYYLVLPKKNNVDKNKGKKNYLFVETHNTGKVGDDMRFHIEEAYTVAENGSNYVADKLGLPRIVPILVRPESQINNQWVYTHALSRNTIFLEDMKKEAGQYAEVFEPMDRVDRQVANMIKHANENLRKSGWKMEDKVFFWGFSASGDFANRFSFLYPEMVKAACFSGYPVFPIKKEQKYNMIYPLGAYDYKKITGKEFSLKAYNSVARLGYVGSADNNDPAILDTPYEQEIQTKLLSLIEYPDKWNKATKIFKKSGGQAQTNVYIGAGHEPYYKGMTQDYINFFSANRDSKTPVYVKPSDPKNTLTEIFSKNVKEMKTPKFSYDKTTIIEAFWSGTTPKTMPKSMAEWVKENHPYDDRSLFFSIEEWQHGNHDQMDERIKKVSGEFILRAKGHKDIKVVCTGSTSNGTGNAQAYSLYVMNPQDMVSGVKYEIIDKTGHWIVCDGVYVERPVQ